MNVLAVDTATAVCRVGIAVAGQLFSAEAAEARDHARLLLPMLQDLFDRASIDASQLDLIAWNAGPGSFTGLRIAASAVQALAYAHQLPIVNLSSLALLAHAAKLQDGERALCVLDARMSSVYVACYECNAGVLSERIEEQLLSLEAAKVLIAEGRYDRLLGVDAELLGVAGEAVTVLPNTLLAMAQTVDQALWCEAVDCAPRYLRDATQWQKRTRIRP